MDLLKLQKDRQLMETDTKLLDNRIKMLEKEEEKLLKKIDTTRKRATEITELKRRNDKEFQMKIDMKRTQMDRQLMNRNRFVEQRNSQKMVIMSNRGRLITDNN